MPKVSFAHSRHAIEDDPNLLMPPKPAAMTLSACGADWKNPAGLLSSELRTCSHNRRAAHSRCPHSAFRQRLQANGNLSTTFQAGLMSLAHPSCCPRTAQHFIARDCSHRLILLSCDARHATTNNGKAKRRPSFKPVSVRVRTSLSTRAPIDVRKMNFDARDFGLFEAQVRAGRHPETANVGPTYRVTCGNVGHY